jgi:hypothetical protein
LIRTRTNGAQWDTVLIPFPDEGFEEMPAIGGVLTHSDANHPHLMLGNGVYNSTDAGTHWTYAPVA